MKNYNFSINNTLMTMKSMKNNHVNKYINQFLYTVKNVLTKECTKGFCFFLPIIQ